MCCTVASSTGLPAKITRSDVDRDHMANLDVGRRDRFAVDHQSSGTVAVGDRDEHVGCRHHAGVRHELDPVVVDVGEHRRRRAGRRCRRPAPPAGVGRGTEPSRSTRARSSARRRGTGSRSRSHSHLAWRRTVERAQVERDIGVGGAGGRVAHSDGRDAGIATGRRCATPGPAPRRRGRRRSSCRRATTSTRAGAASPRRR